MGIVRTALICIVSSAVLGSTASAAKPRGTVSALRAMRAARPRPMLRRANAPPSVPAPASSPVRIEPSRARAPHNMGLSGSYSYRPAAPPPPASALAPRPSIEQEFLTRIAIKHATPTQVKATRPDRINDFDPNNPGDSQTVILGGAAAAPGASGAHNRDQGGKPEDKKNK